MTTSLWPRRPIETEDEMRAAHTPACSGIARVRPTRGGSTTLDDDHV